MLTCPMCKKSLRPLTRECPSCRADLSLLVDYTEHLDQGLARAEELTRTGELGEAMWAYLEVLEVDPEQPEARRQVGRVAAAVRQFDREKPGRLWRRRAGSPSWQSGIFWVCTALLAFALGYWLGQRANGPAREDLQTPVLGQPTGE